MKACIYGLVVGVFLLCIQVMSYKAFATSGCGRHCNEKTNDDTYVDCGWGGAPKIKAIVYNPTYACEDPVDVDGGCIDVEDNTLPNFSIVGTLSYDSKDTYRVDIEGDPNTVDIVQIATGAAPPSIPGFTYTFLFTGDKNCENKTLSPSVDCPYKAQKCKYPSS